VCHFTRGIILINIAQITDPHISPDDTKRYGIDNRSRFLKTLSNIKKYGVDLLVITGDMALSNGELESYIWLRKQLDEYNFNYITIPGNHDNAQLMLKIMHDIDINIDSEYYFYKDFDNHRLVFMDSSNNIISKDQLLWLKDLNDNSINDISVFVHHPLDYGNCAFMDSKYSLENIREVKELLVQCKKIKHIFSGHYHTGKEYEIGHIKQFIAPSTWFQLDTVSKDFKMDSKNFGWLQIKLNKNDLETKIHYL